MLKFYYMNYSCARVIHNCHMKFTHKTCEILNPFKVKQLKFNLDNYEKELLESKKYYLQVVKIVKQNKQDCENENKLYQSSVFKLQSDIDIVDQIEKVIKQRQIEVKKEIKRRIELAKKKAAEAAALKKKKAEELAKKKAAEAAAKKKKAEEAAKKKAAEEAAKKKKAEDAAKKKKAEEAAKKKKAANQTKSKNQTKSAPKANLNSKTKATNKTTNSTSAIQLQIESVSNKIKEGKIALLEKRKQVTEIEKEIIKSKIDKITMKKLNEKKTEKKQSHKPKKNKGLFSSFFSKYFMKFDVGLGNVSLLQINTKNTNAVASAEKINSKLDKIKSSYLQTSTTLLSKITSKIGQFPNLNDEKFFLKKSLLQVRIVSASLVKAVSIKVTFRKES